MGYYRKVEVDDEGEFEAVRQAIFVEIEDTPGSERGNDDDDANKNDVGPPKPRKGARVVLERDKNKVIALFDSFRPRGKLRYRPAMDAMLGKEFTVKAVAQDGSYGLPSPDGSEGGVWNFPPDAVSLKTSLSLPIDQYIHLGEKAKPIFETAKERKTYTADLQRPLAAYDRPIGTPDVDKTVTKNRMGYFICFDISDENGDSLKEAMTVYMMLTKQLLKMKGTSRLKPHIWLIGCKIDRASEEAMDRNRDSAQDFSDKQEIPFYETSARNHKGVQHVFHDMIQAISSRESLWALDGVDIDMDTEQDQSGCVCQ